MKLYKYFVKDSLINIVENNQLIHNADINIEIEDVEEKILELVEIGILEPCAYMVEVNSSIVSVLDTLTQ
ncbi:MAG: hypothetical protein N4A40_12640 [Tissierellales bacterium]|nr:hypothetical protein [Tissierellales bacterium]